MIDFTKYGGKSTDTEDISPLSVFDVLDRHSSHIDLRPTQAEALSMLHERRDDRDYVLKMSTGGGKTTVGLVFLQSQMLESKRPAVYLCPTNQLVSQVMSEAKKLGINIVKYAKKEKYPDSDGVAARAIIVCTYDKLFNAKTTFDRDDVNLQPFSILLDDAHSGVEEVRASFTLRIPAYHEAYNLISSFCDTVFKSACIGTWQAIKESQPYETLEVPYWHWQSSYRKVQKALSKFGNDDEFVFTWPYLRNSLQWCRCIISSEAVEIVPDIPLTHFSRVFSEANHRLFMSATLSDDSILVRELDCDINAAMNPIIPESGKGLGERMVLCPSLVSSELDRKWLMNLCSKLAKKWRIAVFSPSKKIADDWKAVGARSVIGDEAEEAIENLKNGSETFVAFAQRYDGVDLPDDACRILVIDGMPIGQGITDKHDSRTMRTIGGTRGRIIQKLEQAMGRAVRSNADYAVVLLAGKELGTFVSRHEVINTMNHGTKEQLNLTHELTDIVKNENEDDLQNGLGQLIKQCLNRDSSWKDFYNEHVRKAAKSAPPSIDEKRINIALLERQASEFAADGNVEDAIKNIQQLIDQGELEDEAWYLQRLAKYTNALDHAKAMKIQSKAYKKNRALFIPPSNTMAFNRPKKTRKSAENIISWIHEYDKKEAILLVFDEVRIKLSFSNDSENFEQGLYELAKFVGAIGFRPEHETGDGPDVLWIWDGLGFVFEAKNESKSETLTKKTAGQLHNSSVWFKDKYTELDEVPIVVALSQKAHKQAHFADNARVIDQEKLEELLQAIENMLKAIAHAMPLEINTEFVSKQTNMLGLSARDFVNKYTKKIK